MANYQTLKSAIQQVVKTNGNNEITGALLQQSLLAMINSLGSGYHFVGVATPTTNPGTPDDNVFYIAVQTGSYPNFSNVSLNDEIAILKYNGTWVKETITDKLAEYVFNVSAAFPTGGTDGTNVYTKWAAYAAVPQSRRKPGLIVVYRTNTGWVSDMYIAPDNVSRWTAQGALFQTWKRLNYGDDLLDYDWGYMLNGTIVKSDQAYQQFRNSDYIELKYEKFLITEILQRTDIDYADVFNANKQLLGRYKYSSATITNPFNVELYTADFLADYPNAKYVRFCSSTANNVFPIGVYQQKDRTLDLGVYNVSIAQPTGGTGGTDVYTVPNARAAVPVEYRRNGQIIMYRTERGWIQEQFVSENVGNWEAYEATIGSKIYRRVTLFEDKNKNIGGYIAAPKGNVITGAVYVGFSYSDYIELDFSSVLFTHVAKRADMAYMAIYDAKKAMLHTFVYNSTSIPNPDNQTFWVADILEQYPNARYVRFCAYTKDEIFIQGNNLTNINNAVASVEQKVNESLVLRKRGNIVADSSIEAYKGYQNSSGGISGFGTDGTWFNTQFIEVKPNTIISVSNLTGQGTAVMTVGFFDVNKACLRDISILESIGDSGRDISVNDERIRYVRFSGRYAQWFSQTATIIMTDPSGISIPDAIMEMETSIDNNIKDIVALDERVVVLDERVTAIEESGQPGIKYDIEHFICYGQSLSQGDWEPNIVSYAQKYNSLMFTGTPRVWEYRDQANKYNALIPAVEDVFRYQQGETVVGANYRGETPCCGAAEKATEMIIADGFDIDNYQFQMLVSAPGMGGTSIAGLSKGKAIYARLLDDVTNGKRLANASGKSYACRGVMWIQGESDNGQTFAYYYNAMKKLFEDLNTDIKAITGQIEDVHFFLYQTRCYDWYYTGFHYPEIPLAQYQICRDMRNVHFVGPIYHLPLIGDYTHFTAEGSKWYGGYMGRAWKKVIIDREKWDGIYLKSHIVYGNYIELTFGVPVLPLVFDTTNVVDRGVGKGFQIRNVDDFAQNSYLDIITNVQIIRPDTVRITCSQSPSGKRLTYAINGTATPSSRADMGSGNLRDSSTDVFNFPVEENGADVEHKMYNWCPLFDLVLE